MNIETTLENEVLVVRVEGGLDAATSPTLDRRLHEAIEGGNARVLVDLGGVTYLASAGLRALQVGKNLARKHDGDLKLCCLPESVGKLLDLTGFSSDFSIYGTAEAGIASFRNPDEPVDIVTIEGELDAASSPTLQRELIEKLNRGAGKVVLDFSKVVYIASAGFRALQASWMAARSKGGDVRFANLQPKVEEVFSSLGFMQMYGVYPDLPTAVMSFHEAEAEAEKA